MLKLESSSYNIKNLPKIKTFVRKYWPFEKTILTAAYTNFKKDSLVDPASSMVNEGQNFVVFEDTIFSICPSCKGRIFPEFNFCPFCAAPSTGALPANSLFSELNQLPGPRRDGNGPYQDGFGPRRGKRANRRKFMFASFDDKGIFLDDGEVLVTYADLKNELKNLDSIIP
jgi:hypothetical protein